MYGSQKEGGNIFNLLQKEGDTQKGGVPQKRGGFQPWKKLCQSDTLLLADVFENFRKKCIEIYELDPTHFLSAPGLAWQTCLRKADVKLELLTNVDMLLMVEKRIKGGICHAIHRYAKANNKYMNI